VNKQDLSAIGNERRRLLLAAGAGTLGLSLPRMVSAQDKIACRIAHSEAIGSPITVAFDKFTLVLREKSGGRIDAQHFPAGQLGNYTQLIEQNRIGTIQITAGGPDTEEAVAPEIAVAAGAPGFMFKDEAHVDRVLQGPIGLEISAIARRKTGVEFVAYAEVGFRHLLSKRPVTKLEDLKGLKIRTPELRLWVDFWKKLGANPTPLPYAEQYSALSTGVIDGLEADFFSILGFKWFEQARNLTLTGHWFLPKAIRVNAVWLDRLPPDLQKVVRDSALEVFAEQRAVNRAKANDALAQLEKAGTVVHRLSDAEKQRWMAATASLFDEFGAKSPETKAMIAKITALRG
jgi:C4-dicarboxylate-binding protein DctP